MSSQQLVASEIVAAGQDLPATLPPAQTADSGRIRMGGGCQFRPKAKQIVGDGRVSGVSV